MVRTKQDAQTYLENQRAVLSFLSTQIDQAKAKHAKLNADISLREAAINLLRVCLDECIAAKQEIEDIVQGALRDTFEVDYSFVLEPVIEDSITKGVNPRFITPQGVSCDPLEDSGAAFISVGSLFLLIAIVLISNKTKPVIFLDEYLTTVKIERWRKVGEILTKLTNETPLRLVFFTHSTEPFGTIYQVSMTNGVSSVTPLNQD